MPTYITDMLEESGCPWSQHDSIEEIIPKVDILYMTRVQKERLDPSEYANVKAQFILRASHLTAAKPNMKVLHPLPVWMKSRQMSMKPPMHGTSNKQEMGFMLGKHYCLWS